MLFLVFCEICGVFYVYGGEKFVAQIEDMFGFKILKAWWYLLRYAAPLLVAVS